MEQIHESQGQSVSSLKNAPLQEGKPKKEEQDLEIYPCDKCMKKFTNQIGYEAHVKQKHKVIPKDPDCKKTKVIKPTVRNKILQQQQNDLEDSVYAFLGELGELNAETGKEEKSNEEQKLAGQSNYAVNKVVRTPYELEMEAKQNIPTQQIQKSKHSDFMNVLALQLMAFEEQINKEKQIWEFRDPMAPQQETQNEFSLMDIPKLIKNYPRRDIVVKYPHFSIFLLWIARISKPPAWKQFFMAIADYMSLYEMEKDSGELKDLKPKTRWNKFFMSYECKYASEAFVGFKICTQQYGKKFVEYFVKWVELFELVPQ